MEISNDDYPEFDGFYSSFIAIMVPPDLYPQFQAIRTLHIEKLKCGPHITV